MTAKLCLLWLTGKHGPTDSVKGREIEGTDCDRGERRVCDDCTFGEMNIVGSCQSVRIVFDLI